MKYFKSTTSIFVLCVTLLSLAGCTLPSRFEIFNNTGMEVRVTQVISEESISYDLAPNSSVTVESWDAYGDAHFTVIAERKEWHYKPHRISHHFGELKRFSYWLFKLQIEKDGGVFILGPEKEFPQTIHVAQPEGYPLKPANEDENV